MRGPTPRATNTLRAARGHYGAGRWARGAGPGIHRTAPWRWGSGGRSAGSLTTAMTQAPRPRRSCARRRAVPPRTRRAEPGTWREEDPARPGECRSRSALGRLGVMKPRRTGEWVRPRGGRVRCSPRGEGRAETTKHLARPSRSGAVTVGGRAPGAGADGPGVSPVGLVVRVRSSANPAGDGVFWRAWLWGGFLRSVMVWSPCGIQSS